MGDGPACDQGPASPLTRPPAARIRRIYALLNYRYVENLSQEGAAERLGITARHLRREQLDALHVLALRLWAGSEPAATEPAPAAEGVDDLAADESTAELDPPEWRAQLRQELATLHEGAPAAVASLNEIITTVAALGRADRPARHHPACRSTR